MRMSEAPDRMTSTRQREDAPKKLRCANTNCAYAAHSSKKIGGGFCCKSCEFHFEILPSAQATYHCEDCERRNHSRLPRGNQLSKEDWAQTLLDHAGDAVASACLSYGELPPYIYMRDGGEGDAAWSWPYCRLCKAWVSAKHLQSKRHMNRLQRPELYIKNRPLGHAAQNGCRESGAPGNKCAGVDEARNENDTVWKVGHAEAQEEASSEMGENIVCPRSTPEVELGASSSTHHAPPPDDETIIEELAAFLIARNGHPRGAKGCTVDYHDQSAGVSAMAWMNKTDSSYSYSSSNGYLERRR